MKQDQIRIGKTGPEEHNESISDPYNGRINRRQDASISRKHNGITGGIGRIPILVLAVLISISLAGCKPETDRRSEKIRDIDFTVLAEEEIPEEIRTMVEEKKETEFKLTFQDGSALYICIGYGRQEQGGYSITVKDLYETENAVYADTNLIGPDAEQKELYQDPAKKSPSFPYLVLKTEYINKVVVFE